MINWLWTEVQTTPIRWTQSRHGGKDPGGMALGSVQAILVAWSGRFFHRNWLGSRIPSHGPNVGHIWWFEPLWKMKVSWDYDIPNIWKNKKHVPNHQPDIFTVLGIYSENLLLFPLLSYIWTIYFRCEYLGTAGNINDSWVDAHNYDNNW